MHGVLDMFSFCKPINYLFLNLIGGHINIWIYFSDNKIVVSLLYRILKEVWNLENYLHIIKIKVVLILFLEELHDLIKLEYMLYIFCISIHSFLKDK